MKHRARLASLNDRLRVGGQEAALELYDTDRLSHIVALTEVGELASIEPFLRACDPPTLYPKLRDALAGPVLPNEEDTNSNRARNILFELNLASKLWRAGIMSTLGEEPDLSCTLDDIHFLIHCKRAFSATGAKGCIDRARAQLKRDLKKAPKLAQGIIALSVSRLINTGNRVLFFKGEANGRKALKRRLFVATTSIKQSWAKSDASVQGIIFHAITPAFDKETRLLVMQQLTHGYGLVSKGSSDSGHLRSLFDRLREIWH